MNLLGFIVAMIVLVEIYLRLEDRLLTANAKQLLVTDDIAHPLPSFLANLTKVRIDISFRKVTSFSLLLMLTGTGYVRNDRMHRGGIKDSDRTRSYGRSL